jgi:hypothetical protein
MKRWKTGAKRLRKIYGLAERLSPALGRRFTLAGFSLPKRIGPSAGADWGRRLEVPGETRPTLSLMYARYPPIPLNSGLEVACFDSASGLIRPVPYDRLGELVGVP